MTIGTKTITQAKIDKFANALISFGYEKGEKTNDDLVSEWIIDKMIEEYRIMDRTMKIREVDATQQGL